MILFDTNVFVACIVKSHTHHDPSRILVEKVHRGEMAGLVCAHSLAECFSILTSYPIPPSIPPDLAERLIEENILAYFRVVELTVTDYRSAIKRIRERRLRSGAIYDSLIYQAAVKKKAKGLYTWDVEDFERLADPGIPVLKPSP